MSKAYPIGNGKRFAVFFSINKQGIIVSRENVKQTKEVCDSIPPNTQNRKTLIFKELKKRGIIE